MNRKIYYIETTMNGYVTTRIEICDFDKNEDYIDKLIFELEGAEINYYEDISGYMDELDQFLEDGSTANIDEYENVIGESPSVYLDSWHTLVTGCITNKFVGLEIK